LNEIRFADVMAGFLLPRHAPEKIGDVVVPCSVAKQASQVVLDDAEEAGADFAVGGHADPIAMAAKRLADRRDDADFGASARQRPTGGRFGGIPRGQRFQGKPFPEAVEGLATWHPHFPGRGAPGIQWHEFDESE
jgi:hypothetical protein